VRLAFDGVFSAQVSGKEAHFPNELLSFTGGRYRRLHFFLVRAAQFVERIGGQFRIIKVHIHEARRELKGMKSRAATAWRVRRVLSAV
jgi:hypothetical protein